MITNIFSFSYEWSSLSLNLQIPKSLNGTIVFRPLKLQFFYIKKDCKQKNLQKDVKDFLYLFLKSKIAIDVKVQIFTFTKWSVFQICQICATKCGKKSKDKHGSLKNWKFIYFFKNTHLYHQWCHLLFYHKLIFTHV
jgi:hypothetical protein